MRDTRRLISITKAAAILDVHPRTIRRKIASGELVGYRLGRLVKVDQNDLERLLRRIPTAGDAA